MTIAPQRWSGSGDWIQPLPWVTSVSIARIRELRSCGGGSVLIDRQKLAQASR